MSEQSPKTFISYVRVDSEFALKLANDLKSAGADVWVDKFDIPPGEPWDRAIESAVKGCPRMLVVLSPASVKSENVMNEISFALDHRKAVIPVLYQACEIPLRLYRLEYVDFTKDYGSGLTRLLDAFCIQNRKPQEISKPSEPSHLELLKKAIEAGDIAGWNQWRTMHCGTVPDLRQANLRGKNLREADLHEADLAEADLSGADLFWANLHRANLSGADLRGAKLMWACLTRANLEGAHLNGAHITEATGVTQEQISAASGDRDTRLPPDLQRPDHWEK